MAYAATPKSTAVTLTTHGTAYKAPGTAQANRLLLKIFNDDQTNPIFYGDSAVTVSSGIYIAPGGESDWIPCSGDIYVINNVTDSATVRTLELA